MRRLTPRELEVLKLISQGYSNEEIANRIFVSRHTVKAHLESIYYKFQVHNRIKAIILAMQNELLAPEDIDIEVEKEYCYLAG